MRMPSPEQTLSQLVAVSRSESLWRNCLTPTRRPSCFMYISIGSLTMWIKPTTATTRSFPFRRDHKQLYQWLIFNKSHSQGRNGGRPTFKGRGKSLKLFLPMLIFNLLSCAHAEIGSICFPDLPWQGHNGRDLKAYQLLRSKIIRRCHVIPIL